MRRLIILLLLLLAIGGASRLLAADPYGLASRAAFSAYNGNKLPINAQPVSGTWSTTVAYPSLTFLNPLGVLPMPGTNKLVVWGREGYVWSFTDDPAVKTKKLILDLHANCQGWDDMGLLGLAFHPDFAHNHYVYVWYNWVATGRVKGDANPRPPNGISTRQRLARFTYNPTTGVLVRASEYVILDQIDHNTWHNGGGLFFHPGNGFLYLTNGNDANGDNDQRIDGGLFGCLIRIDVDKRGGAISHAPTQRATEEVGANWPHAYFIPNDNPFVGVSGAREEIYALGLRSPHRMTYDAASQRIFIGDVGEGSFEEVDVIEPGDPAGLNFQWSVIEGYHGDLVPPYLGVNKRPIVDYPHGGDGSAVIGGYVYRGSALPELVGKYVFGDNLSNTIWYLDESTHTATTPATKVPLATLPKGPGPNSGGDYTGLSSFGYDTHGELLLCQLSSTGGQLYRLSSTGPEAKQMPLTLSATGVFSDLATLTPAPGFVAYDVNTPLWSDGAHKQRWFAVPDGATIGYQPTGEWAFPDGSVFVKHFELPTDDAHPAQTQRRETRVLVRDSLGHVYGGSYKWRADSSDADLVVDGVTEDVTIHNADTSTRTQPWYYPGRQDCVACHNPASSGVLGLNAQQSNRAHLFPETGTTDNQLRAWNHAGYFTAAIDEASLGSLLKLVALDDPQATVEQRARSYLDANCAHCHRPGGVRAFWDARYETPLDEAHIINGIVGNTLGIPTARVIVPGDLASSILHKRLSTATENYKMPPLAKNVVDAAAVSVIEQWIATVQPLPPKPLDAPWTHADVGNVALLGDATMEDGTFTIHASGDDIWGGTDQFHYIFHSLVGNGQLTARVVSETPLDSWTKAGVMIRETLDTHARHAMTAVTPGNGIAFQRRHEPAGDSLNTNLNGEAPHWVRLVRSGNVFISSESADGVAWHEIGRDTIPMNTIVHIGLCLTSHFGGELATATFDHVNFTGTQTVPLTTRPPAVLTGPFSWKLSSDVPAPTFQVTGLPPGLKFSAATGTISGTPAVSGSFPLSLTARLADGSMGAQKITLTVAPFPSALAGAYGGLVARDSTVNGDLGGGLAFTITKTGMVTGKLALAGGTAPFTGRAVATPAGDATVAATIRRAGQPSFTLALALTGSDATGTGTVTVAATSANVAVRHALTDASAHADPYNARLTIAGADLGDLAKPQGTGWLHGKVTKTGAISLAGALADGTPVSFSAVVANDATVPLFAGLYAGHGAISGTPTLGDGTPVSTHLLSGGLDWRKLAPASAKDHGYPVFTATPQLTGREYRAPAPGNILLGLPNQADNARLDFTGAGLALAAHGAAASQTFRLTTANRALFSAAVNPCGTTLLADAKSGLFKGTFRLVDGATTRTVKYFGVVLGGEAIAPGFFTLPPLPTPATGAVLSGTVELKAH